MNIELYQFPHSSGYVNIIETVNNQNINKAVFFYPVDIKII